ncbi:stage V sporulation protein AD [Suilimivivens sp.]|uniref:stage V sporulation protein AD n=1 Tax=Suilimivivens sp. TaxID=2981669 RepID=UPI000E584F82|nr:stage V sporulation protein AD [Lachnospiraceae bacterium OM04-12BH]
MDSWKGAFFEQGRQSIKIPVPVYIRASASIAGSKEGDGPLGDLFDMVGVDDKFGSNTWEEAESTLQKETLQLAIGKAGLSGEDIRFLLAGDLLAQSMASSFGLASFQIPLIGLYGACSTCGLSLAMAAALIVGGMAQYVASVTSSHFASAEKEFRYPLGYGNQRPLSATWTVTGSGAFILSSLKGKKDRAVITGLTIGKIVDLGMKDSMNMGACMAPAASSLICQHFADFGRTPEDYDRIITGDLGLVGQRVLLDMLAEKGFDLSGKHMDCGIEIYDEKQDAHAGGSGCGCSAVVLSALILKKLEEGEWKRVLFVPTGALLSKTSFNEGKSIPGIAHALVLERCS